MKVKRILQALCLASVCALPLQAQASLFGDDEARRAILDLRGRIEAMNGRLEALSGRVEGKSDKTASLEFANQNEQLKAEIQRLRGQIEELANTIANEQRRQKSFYADLDARLKKLEPQRMTVDGKEVDVGPSEQRQYEAALALFKANDYRGAAAAFSSFLANNPGSPYSGSALYWLGSSHYALRDYRSAIASHRALVDRYPDNPRAPDALLNVATSHLELKDRPSARNVLDTLISQYPNTQAAATAKERLAGIK